MKYWEANGLPWWLSSKESGCQAGVTDSFPGSGNSPGEGIGNLLQYPCLENPMYRGAWRATAHGVVKSWTQLKRLSSSSSNNRMKRILERWPPCKTFHLDINATTLSGFSNLKANNDIFHFTQRHPGKFPKVPGRRRGTRGFPAAPPRKTSRVLLQRVSRP